MSNGFSGDRDWRSRTEIRERFPLSGLLTGRKLREYLPALLLTNLSVLLLTSVDGLVVGNFVGSDALSSVNIFAPCHILIGAVSVMAASGTATALSTCLGRNDMEKLPYLKKAAHWLTALFAVMVAVLQIPVVYLMIRSYHLSPELEKLTWQYAVGCMVSLPFGLVSSMGVYQLQILGKMKVLAGFSAMESVINLLLDLLFVRALGMGVSGAGYGTAGANLVRCAVTVLYLARKTDMYRCGGIRVRWRDIRAILSAGMPESANTLILAAQNYCMMRIILSAFGGGGGVIKGVCAFCLSLASVVISGIQGSMRPLVGLLTGAKDTEGLRLLMRQCMTMLAMLVGVLTAAIWAAPQVFYHVHGVSAIPEYGLLSLRIYAGCFLLMGFDTLFRLYFSNRGDSRYAAGITIAANITLPLFALVLSRMFSAPWIWLSYLLTELLIFSVNMGRYRRWIGKDQSEGHSREEILYLTVKPEEAIEASRLIRRYAEEHGYPKRIAYRVSLCMEEMVSYAVLANGSDDVSIQIMIRFSPEDALFLMLDDGRCIMLNDNPETARLITDNYGLMRKVAKSVQYQYVLNMNYTVLTF